MADQSKTGNEPLAAAVNWQGLATFLGRRVDEVKTLALPGDAPKPKTAVASGSPKAEPQ
jgi:hypothetical protein